MVSMKGNEAHENTISRNPCPKFPGNPDRGNGAAVCGLLIGKDFPIETAFLGTLGRGREDLHPSHPVNSVYLTEEGVELSWFEILEFILKGREF